MCQTLFFPARTLKKKNSGLATPDLVSRSQTAFFSFILGREKKGSGTPPIEKPVLASTATGVGVYWQWLLCNR